MWKDFYKSEKDRKYQPSERMIHSNSMIVKSKSFLKVSSPLSKILTSNFRKLNLFKKSLKTWKLVTFGKKRRKKRVQKQSVTSRVHSKKRSRTNYRSRGKISSRNSKIVSRSISTRGVSKSKGRSRVVKKGLEFKQRSERKPLRSVNKRRKLYETLQHSKKHLLADLRVREGLEMDSRAILKGCEIDEKLVEERKPILSSKVSKKYYKSKIDENTR